MKMKWLSVLLLLVGISAWGKAPGDLPFQRGEWTRFSVMFKWGAVNTEVATGELSLDSLHLGGVSAYHASLKARTAPFFEAFYSMNENFQTWFSPETLKNIRHTRDTHQGSYHATNEFQYDWDKKVIHARIEFDGKPEQTLEIPLHDGVYDIASMLYYLRSLELDEFPVGKQIHMSFAIDDSVFDIVLTYQGKETLRVRRMGKVDALRYSCTVVSGAMFDGSQPMQLWFSDDENLIPVAFMAPLRIGSVRGWLKNYGGLKYDFSARH